MAKASQAAEAEEDLVGGGEGSNARPKKNVEVGSAAARKLKTYISRIEKLDSEKQTFVEDIKTVYSEIKAAGYDTKVVRRLVAERKKDAAQQQEFEAVLDLYKHALGMAPPAAE